MLARPRIVLPLLAVVAVAGGLTFFRRKDPPAEMNRSSPASAWTFSEGRVAGAVGDPQSVPQVKAVDFSRWDVLSKINDATARHRKLMGLLAALRSEDFIQAAEKLGHLGFAAKSEEMQLLVSAWCNADIHGAAAFVTGGGVPELVKVVAEDWGQRDYDEAAAWALGIEPPGSLRDYALARIILPSVERDPDRALATMLRGMTPDNHLGQQVTAAIMSRRPGIIQELIAKMPDGPGKQWATGHMVALIAHGGGMRWTMTMPGGSVSDRIDVVPTFTPGERALAAVRIASYHLPATAGTATSPRLFLEYTQDDRAASTALVESMPAGNTRENAMAGVAAAISLSDGIEAGLAYLGDCPDETRSLYLKTWAEELSKTDPAKVLEQAARFAEFPEGKAVIRDGFFTLRSRDLSAADRWLEANPGLAPLVEGLH